MIADLKPYSAMKESGAQWLGLVPEHWGVLPNRALFTELKERDHPEEEMLSVTITRGVIPQRALLTDSSKKDGSNQDRSAYKFVRPGDIVYNKMRAWQGALGAATHQGIVSPAYVVQRPHAGAEARYLHYLLRIPAFAKEAERWSYGITSDMWCLRPEHFKMIYGCLPPLSEQRAIARFLDHADRRIRRYILAKKRLIVLLNEERQAIIRRAVSRGVDPNVRLKPSGIEWLGDVPGHWLVSRLKFETTHIVDCLHATPQYTKHGEYPAIRTADVEPGRLRLESARRISLDQYTQWTDRLVPEAGDILYSREGERFGIAALVPPGVKLCISQRMMVFRVRFPQNSAFVMWQLNCPHVYAQAAADVVGATSPHVNVERIKNYWITLPPVTEQQAIAELVALKTRAPEGAAKRIEREIALVREYRTRLIADVVTGKLDVREAAAQLPDGAAEPEPLADADATEEAAEEADEGGETAREEAEA